MDVSYTYYWEILQEVPSTSVMCESTFDFESRSGFKVFWLKAESGLQSATHVSENL